MSDTGGEASVLGAGGVAAPDAGAQKRNKNFDETHRALIEKAVELISRSGVEALSVSALARASGMNRSTLYYHFESREALIAAVRSWSSGELARAFNPDGDRRERNDHITRFVLRHPEVIKLWIDDFISPGDIRERYPHWDQLVAGFDASFRAAWPDEQPDGEVFAVFLLAGAFIGPRIFHNSVAPQESIERIIERFTRETMRMLGHEGLLATWVGASEDAGEGAGDGVG
jgi:AcrR family transcriptional regulator